MFQEERTPLSLESSRDKNSNFFEALPMWPDAAEKDIIENVTSDPDKQVLPVQSII